MVSSKPLTLVGTGLALGVVHVLTGPDHLSALAALSANVPYYQAFWLGIRWGVGHSTGLVVVATIFLIIALRRVRHSHDDKVEFPDRVALMFDILVGVFMICLGLYGIQRARQKQQSCAPTTLAAGHLHHDVSQQPQPGASSALGVDNDVDEETAVVRRRRQLTTETNQGATPEIEITRIGLAGDGESEQKVDMENEEDTKSEDDDSRLLNKGGGDNSDFVSTDAKDDNETRSVGSTIVKETDKIEENIGNNDTTTGDNRNEEEPSSNQGGGCIGRCNRLVRRIPVKTMALLAGIIHGMSGPGAVLGVIPAVQLRNPKLSALYLATFCVASTLTMGCYATLYGLCSTRLSAVGCCTNTHTQKRNSRIKLDFVIECVSSALALAIGITWLVLLSLGLLDKVFP